jgi:hypothetical protein
MQCDAGTGVQSLQWICTLSTQSWTAVAASEGMATRVRDTVASQARDQDRVVVGNWIDGLRHGHDYVIAAEPA